MISLATPAVLASREPKLADFPTLNTPLREIPPFLAHGFTVGRRESLYPAGLAFHAYDYVVPEVLRDGTEVGIIGVVSTFKGEEFIGQAFAVERRSDKQVLLVGRTEFESLRLPAEADRTHAKHAAWQKDLNGACFR
jgi:hypothetical protein